MLVLLGRMRTAWAKYSVFTLWAGVITNRVISDYCSTCPNRFSLVFSICLEVSRFGLHNWYEKNTMHTHHYRFCCVCFFSCAKYIYTDTKQTATTTSKIEPTKVRVITTISRPCVCARARICVSTPLIMKITSKEIMLASVRAHNNIKL